jgi:hypothetical protein
MLKLFKTGQRVVDLNDRSLLVISNMHWKPDSDLVRVMVEDSTRFELIPSKQLTSKSQAEQYPALGGSYGQ